MARHLNRAPAVLRERGLISRLRAIDLGDVAPLAYQDFTRPLQGARNEDQVIAYSRSLADRVSAAIAHGQFAVVLGGDCSIVLGCLLAARRKVGESLGLIYADAHADYAIAEESRTGSAAGMALALATGRGNTPLARLAGSGSLVTDRRTAVIGRRDANQDWCGLAALAASSILDVPSAQLQRDDGLYLADVTLDHVAGPDGRGFWIQIDADVLNPLVMSAVDSPEPGGPTPPELLRLLTPLVRHPKALGLSLTTYDPALDPDRSCARQLVRMLETLLAPATAH